MLNKSQIEHLANLARLDINEAEKKKYAEQISSVLEYFRQLDELDTSKVEPTDHITGLQNVTREDEVREIYSTKKILKAAPEIEANQVKVKAVFKED